MDILLHNLSHADLLLGVVSDAQTPGTDEEILIARPKFSKFHGISKSLFEHIRSNMSQIQLYTSALFRRHTAEDSHIVVPVGFDLSNSPPFECDIGGLRFRHDLKETEENGIQAESRKCRVHFAYFPLLAVLLQRWVHHTTFIKRHLILVSGRGMPIDTSSREVDNSTQYVGHLVDLFVKLSPDYRQFVVDLIHSDTNLFRYDENILFVKRELLPVIMEMRRQIVAQKKDKWRDFMRMTLSFADGSSARISAINQSLKQYQPAYMHFWSLKSFWRELKIYDDDVEFHTYEEIATEPAMRLKDITDPLILKAVEEIDKFHKEFEAVASSNDNDLRKFWLRKTMKSVLAVLIVEKNGKIIAYRGTNLEVSLPTGSLCAERNAIGTAFSADMSLKREDIKLVAVYSASYDEEPSAGGRERRAESTVSISSSTIGERDRADSSAFSVAAAKEVSSDPSFNSSMTSPVKTEQQGPLSEDSTGMSNHPATPRMIQRGASMTSRTRAILQINDHADVNNENGNNNHKSTLSPTAVGSAAPTEPSSVVSDAKTPVSLLPMRSPKRKSSFALTSTTSPTAAATNAPFPARKKKKVPFSSPIPAVEGGIAQRDSQVTSSLVSNGSSNNLTGLDTEENGGVFCGSNAEDALLNGKNFVCERSIQGMAKMETIETGASDLNPLKPCGTCTSWLRKIVKCNPDFRVVTFTDALRQGIYVEYVQE